MSSTYPTHPRFRDLTGQRFGRLAVLSFGGRERKHSYWNCVCDCGVAKRIRAQSLVEGRSRSCGCLHPEITVSIFTTHGHALKGAPSLEYGTWSRIIQRCTNPNDSRFSDYGGRGIRVCDRWLHSFANFYADMGPKPTARHSIDRFPDNDGDYEPGNVRWATSIQQQRNTRQNRLLTFSGKTQCLTAWAEELGIKVNTLRSRLSRGFSIEDALTMRKWLRRC